MKSCTLADSISACCNLLVLPGGHQQPWWRVAVSNDGSPYQAACVQGSLEVLGVNSPMTSLRSERWELVDNH